ncbi:MAG: heavy metal-binding domain-containing protein [Hamadaea sp.]|uniref:heavy metal-binding domain-containing protein n=1 Tax=Hamadaea sp. NPDC050747 TaxID=3155789 RepID=UPI00181AC073|nr:heavy metal-binding domain-containing protein [Hamadaea sp.]NUT04185.1 heavy metal-binding domain-containing protein [Hamadaea sp.]
MTAPNHRLSTRHGILVVTTDAVYGRAIHQVLGQVLGIAARSKNPYGEGFVSLRTGGSNGADVRRDLLVACRWEAVDDMTAAAAQFGADAVVAMRFDHRQVTESWFEVCAYGTAVVLAPASSEIPAARRAPAYADATRPA